MIFDCCLANLFHLLHQSLLLHIDVRVQGEHPMYAFPVQSRLIIETNIDPLYIPLKQLRPKPNFISSKVLSCD